MQMAMQHDYKAISAEVESDFLCCQVCLEHYTESDERSPRVSPCGHTLCISCISSVLASSDPRCPFCKHWYPESASLHTFPKNFILLGLMSFFPKTRGALNVLQFSRDEKHEVEEEVVATDQDVEYYNCLIQKAENRLIQLREKQTAAVEKNKELKSHLDGLNKNISRLNARMDSNVSNDNQGDIGEEGGSSNMHLHNYIPAQLQPHLVPPPPPPRSAPHPLLQIVNPAASRHLRRLQDQQRMLGDRMREHVMQQTQASQENGRTRLSVDEELRARFSGARMSTLQRVPATPRQIEGENEESELQRVFRRRQQRGSVQQSVSAGAVSVN